MIVKVTLEPTDGRPLWWLMRWWKRYREWRIKRMLLAILRAANILVPEVVNVIQIFRHKDGSATVITELDAASQASADVQSAVAKWQAAHKPVE